MTDEQLLSRITSLASVHDLESLADSGVSLEVEPRISLHPSARFTPKLKASARGPNITAIGVDVGARAKGFHVVALEHRDRIAFDRVFE